MHRHIIQFLFLSEELGWGEAASRTQSWRDPHGHTPRLRVSNTDLSGPSAPGGQEGGSVVPRWANTQGLTSALGWSQGHRPSGRPGSSGRRGAGPGTLGAGGGLWSGQEGAAGIGLRSTGPGPPSARSQPPRQPVSPPQQASALVSKMDTPTAASQG